jgi:hypothetical protein
VTEAKYLQDGFDKKLAHVIEECGEFLAAAGKTQRWGPFSVNPELPREMQEFNVDWLWREMMDLSETMGRLIESIQAGEHKRADSELSEARGEIDRLTHQAMLDQVTIQNYEIASQSDRAVDAAPTPVR